MKVWGTVGVAAGTAVIATLATVGVYQGVVVPRLESQKLELAATSVSLIEQINACQASLNTQTDAVLNISNGYTSARAAVEVFFTSGDLRAGDPAILFGELGAQDATVLAALTASNGDPNRATCVEAPEL